MEGRTRGREGWDSNYEVGAYGMEWMLNRKVFFYKASLYSCGSAI